MVFTNPDHAFAAALWCVGTHLWPLFDAFPYLIITSATKRSGKTRLSELLSFLSANPINAAGTGPAPLFRMVSTMKPTIILDEAEELNAEGASVMRSFLNIGYRKGQKVLRAAGDSVKQWDAYCPKMFVLIGDVYDTLRDRSIIVRLQRGEPSERFVFDIAQTEGHGIREQLADQCADAQLDVQRAYESHAGLEFLQDRDEEIWTPLFAICAVIAPHRMAQLERVAADLSVEKSLPARSFIKSGDAERQAENLEYAERLLRDILVVIDGRKSMFTADVIEGLKAIATAPWRKYRGTGITPMGMAELLDPHGVAPQLVRIGKVVQRGYKREDVERAVKGL
jgi:hypothetical protein